MKPGAWIFALLSICLLTQPIFESFGAGPAYPSCSSSESLEPSCSMGSCSKEESPADEKDCVPDGCNPFLGCSAGNFYAHYYWTISIYSLIIPKEKISLVDDKRLIKQMSEFWHPPES